MTYSEYLLTEHWRKIRRWVLEFWRGRCALCFSDTRVEVHHRHYDSLGHELITDLLPLCHECHEWHHQRIGLAYS